MDGLGLACVRLSPFDWLCLHFIGKKNSGYKKATCPNATRGLKRPRLFFFNLFVPFFSHKCLPFFRSLPLLFSQAVRQEDFFASLVASLEQPSKAPATALPARSSWGTAATLQLYATTPGSAIHFKLRFDKPGKSPFYSISIFKTCSISSLRLSRF